MLVWGRDDPLNPIAGGAVRRGGRMVVRPSAEGSWRQWSALLECRDFPLVDRSVRDVTRRVARACNGGSEAVLVEIDGLGHQWPGGRVVLRLVSGPGSDAFDATDQIWTFFKSYAR
jgi:poly(3-hydroxybutyrate) depolymerase